MALLLQEMLERMESLHQSIADAFSGLPQEALDWHPGAEMNSLNELIAHVCGAERFWVGEMAGQEPMDRNRPAEFRTEGLDEEALKQLLSSTMAHTTAVLERLSLDDLGREQESVNFGGPFTVAWSLMHALEHTAVHTGHIQMTRQLWEQRGQA